MENDLSKKLAKLKELSLKGGFAIAGGSSPSAPPMQTKIEDPDDWAIKYKPTKPSEFLCTAEGIRKLEAFASGNAKRLLLVGPPGVGKTTIADALSTGLYDVLRIEASIENGVDVIRNWVLQFVSTVSFFGKQKLVVLDEIDNLSFAAQAAMKGSTMNHARFILTCNSIDKVAEPIRSRCVTIDFGTLSDSEKIELHRRQFEIACDVLRREGVVFDVSDVKIIADRHFLDMRCMLQDLQALSGTNKRVPKLA